MSRHWFHWFFSLLTARRLFFCFAALAIAYFPLLFLGRFITTPTFPIPTVLGPPRLLSDTHQYLGLAYATSGMPYGFFWQAERQTFFYAALATEVSTAPQEGPVDDLSRRSVFFSRNSSALPLPLQVEETQVLPHQQPLRAQLIAKTATRQRSRWFPTAGQRQPPSAYLGFSYSLGRSLKTPSKAGVYYSALDEKGLLYQVRFLPIEGEEQLVSPFRQLPGHFYHPNYWPARQTLFYNAIVRERSQGAPVFAYKLILTTASTSSATTLFMSTNLSLKPLQLELEAQGDFFLYGGFASFLPAARQAEMLTQLRGAAFASSQAAARPYDFTLEFNELSRLYSFALHPHKAELLLLADDRDGARQAIFSVPFKKEKNSPAPLTFFEVVLLCLSALLAAVLVKLRQALSATYR